MENTIIKITRILSYVFMVLAAIFLVLVWAYGDDVIETNLKVQGNVLSLGFISTYLLVGLCAIMAIGFPIFFILRNPKTAIRVLIILGSFIAVAAITYALSSGNIEGDVYQKFEITSPGSKRIGAAIVLTYILGIGAIVAMVWSGISSIFRK